MKIRARAKINLYLHITGRREDAYHEIESLLVPVGLADDIEIIPSDKISLEVSGQFASAAGVDDNIVLKAANLLAKERHDLGAHIRLVKNIPTGAGLGGGSADAAAVLRGLNEIWGMGYSLDELAKLGLKLGADVPFCVYDRPAIVSGIGEVIKPVNDLPDLPVLLVNPNISLPTKDVFNKYKEITSVFSDKGFDVNRYISGHNDLESAAISICPAIKDVLNVLQKQKNVVFSRMSGSGATCFAVFESQKDKDMACLNISKNYNNWFSCVA